MPRPLIINVQSHQRRPYHSGSNTESGENLVDDDVENYHGDAYVTKSKHNFSSGHRRHRHGKKSKQTYSEKELQEPTTRRHPGHRRKEKSIIARSKSMADLKRNRRQHEQEEEENLKKYQRRHSNTEQMFNFKETFSKFESLTNTEPQDGNVGNVETKTTITPPKTRGRSATEKEASDLREIDQIKSRARLLVQEARHIDRRDNQNYFEWQDEVIQLLKKIGEIDNRNSEAVQSEKQKTLRIFKQSYISSSSPEVRKVEKVKTTTVRNGLPENKINVYDEVDPPAVKVSHLRNLYEQKQSQSQSNEVPKPASTTYKEFQTFKQKQLEKPQNVKDSEYSSSSRYSVSSSSGSEDDERVYDVHENEIHKEQSPPRERNVEESHIAKVRDLRGVFERDNEENNVITTLPAQIATTRTAKYEEGPKLSDDEEDVPTTRPSKWIIKTDEEPPQKESSGIYRVDDQGLIVDPSDDGPKTVKDTLADEEVLHSVSVKDLKHVFDGNTEVHTSTMRITLEQRYIPYEESISDRQQTVVITELNDEENPVDTSHIARVKELKDAIEKNEDTTEVNQVRYQVVSGSKHQQFIEIEKSERAVISELTSTNGDGTTTDDAHDEDKHKDEIIIEEVTIKPDDPNEGPQDEVIKDNVVVRDTELTEQERVLISRKVLDVINEDIHSYEKEINNLDSGDEEKRMFLNEMLLRTVIQLENFVTYQNEELLRERKEALLFVRECIRKLKANIPAEVETN